MKLTNLNSELENNSKVEELINSLKGKKITILGHDNIDVDATLSGILMSQLLDFLEIENEFCIMQEVKEDDTYTILHSKIKTIILSM